MKSFLTKREKEIFELLISNYSTKEVALILNISEKIIFKERLYV